MATRTTKTSTVKAKTEKSSKTSAPKVSRARPTKVTTEVEAPASDLVAERAYLRFCERGHEHGHDVEDWLAAEQILRQG